MRISRVLRTSAALVLLLAAGACFERVKTSPQADAKLERRELAEATIAQWSNFSSVTARRLMEVYGAPDGVRADRLIWFKNGPWQRTIVFNLRGIAETGAEHDIIEQAVGYSLTPKQAADVSSIDGRVYFNPHDGLLASRAGQEELNILRLNLADDVVHGRLTPEAARGSYERMVSLEQSGKTSPYLLGLRFTPEAQP